MVLVCCHAFQQQPSASASASALDDLRPGNSARGAVEVHRGPLLFTFPVPGLVNTTVRAFTLNH